MTDRLLLVGMMAVGKTTVGELCAKKLGGHSSIPMPNFWPRRAVRLRRSSTARATKRFEPWRVTCSPRRSPAPSGRDRGRRRRRSLRGQSIVAGALRRRRMATRDDRHAERTSRTRGSETAPRRGSGAVTARSLSHRHPLYASVAGFVIDVDDLPPEEVVARIFDDTGLGDVEQ